MSGVLSRFSWWAGLLCGWFTPTCTSNVSLLTTFAAFSSFEFTVSCTVLITATVTVFLCCIRFMVAVDVGCCRSLAFLSADSTAIASSKALSKVRSGSARSRCWIFASSTLQTSLSRSISFNVLPN